MFTWKDAEYKDDCDAADFIHAVELLIVYIIYYGELRNQPLQIRYFSNATLDWYSVGRHYINDLPIFPNDFRFESYEFDFAVLLAIDIEVTLKLLCKNLEIQ